MHLKWVPRHHDDQEVRRFWQTGGIDADFIETIAEADPQWDGHNLCVSSAIQSMPVAVGPRAQHPSACAQDPKVHSDAMVERRDLLPNADRWPFYRIEPLGADGEDGPPR